MDGRIDVPFGTYVCEGVGPFGVCPTDCAPRTFAAVKLHVSARPLRWQYAHGCSPSHLTFRFLQRSHAATTRSTRRRFSGGSEWLVSIFDAHTTPRSRLVLAYYCSASVAIKQKEPARRSFKSDCICFRTCHHHVSLHRSNVQYRW